jgi:HAE1 family hydrophobic/amphiphilic exporter-1
VQVTTTYPGASPRSSIDTVALPIELQVNGVEGMIYMQSTSTADGTYNADGDLRDRHRPGFRAGAGAEPRAAALASLPQPVQAQGVTVQKKSTAILQIVTLTSPDKRYDSLYPQQLRHHQSRPTSSRACPASANVNGVRRGQYSMRIWLDPEKLYAFGLTPVRRDRGHPAAEPAT